MVKMSNVCENETNTFHQLLTNLLHTETDIRQKAEKAYEEIPLEKKLFFLFHFVCAVQGEEEIVSFAAVLLRRVLASEFEDSFAKLPAETKTQIQSQLLQVIQQNISHSLRKKICDVVAELARNLIDDDGNNHWPDFLRFLFDCANSPNHALKESSLLMFTSVPGVFGNLQMRYLDVIRQMLVDCLNETNTSRVRYASVKALVSFIGANEKEENIHKNFADCLPLLLQVLNYAYDTDKDECESVLKSVVELAELCPRFFRGHLETLLQLCLKVIADESCEEGCRHIALEVIVSLAESAPGMVKKLGFKTISMLVPLLLRMMAALEDEEDWDSVDNSTEEDSDGDPIVAESSLDRLSCALGGKAVIPLVMECVPQMLNDSNWKQRHAGLMCLSSIGEGSQKYMEELLPMLVTGIIPYLQDAHPRVRYAACNCLGQMATDFADKFEKKFHDKVLPGLLQLFGDYSSPRVQAHAGAALVNFFEECPKQILLPYLDTIMDKLQQVISTKLKELVERGTKLVLEQAVVTLAAVADSAEEKFITHYDKFMPCLKYIIQNSNVPDFKLLRGKTIECVSLIGLAVGKLKFVADAGDVMNMLLEAQTKNAEIADDDPQLSFMISSWARICKILGSDFEPYLPFVMEPVMKAAKIKPEVAVLDSDDMKVVEEDDDWQFVSLGEQQNFGIRTSGLEDKATACQMLVCYSRELKEAFSPYVEEVVKLMVPMLKFYFSDPVRSSASEIMPYLLESARFKGEAFVTDMWRYILPELLAVIDSEPENDVLSEHMHAFAMCIDTLEGCCLADEHLTMLMKIFDSKLKEHFERALERAEKRKDEDFDEVTEDLLIEEDDDDVYILSKVADILHSLFSVYKTDLFPYFDRILDHFLRLLQPDRPWADRQWALCVFDDVIEHGGPACVRYQQFFLQPLLTSLNDKSPEVRQAAAYGCGILGRNGGIEFAKVCAESIPLLVSLINAPDSRTVENINATENAIAAVTKILAHNSSCLSLDELIPVWLSWLPVWEDEEEAPHVYNYLCSLLEQNNVPLLGKDNCNLPRIIMIMAEAFLKEAIEPDSEVGRRMISLAKSVQVNAEIFSACIAQLDPQQQEALYAALQGC